MIGEAISFLSLKAAYKSTGLEEEKKEHRPLHGAQSYARAQKNCCFLIQD